jgi:hypothetical protein
MAHIHIPKGIPGILGPMTFSPQNRKTHERTRGYSFARTELPRPRQPRAHESDVGLVQRLLEAERGERLAGAPLPPISHEQSALINNPILAPPAPSGFFAASPSS